MGDKKTKDRAYLIPSKFVRSEETIYKEYIIGGTTQKIKIPIYRKFDAEIKSSIASYTDSEISGRLVGYPEETVVEIYARQTYDCSGGNPNGTRITIEDPGVLRQLVQELKDILEGWEERELTRGDQCAS